MSTSSIGAEISESAAALSPQKGTTSTQKKKTNVHSITMTRSWLSVTNTE